VKPEEQLNIKMQVPATIETFAVRWSLRSRHGGVSSQEDKQGI
jgi:hypothetical protein